MCVSWACTVSIVSIMRTISIECVFSIMGAVSTASTVSVKLHRMSTARWVG